MPRMWAGLWRGSRKGTPCRVQTPTSRWRSATRTSSAPCLSRTKASWRIIRPTQGSHMLSGQISTGRPSLERSSTQQVRPPILKPIMLQWASLTAWYTEGLRKKISADLNWHHSFGLLGLMTFDSCSARRWMRHSFSVGVATSTQAACFHVPKVTCVRSFFTPTLSLKISLIRASATTNACFRGWMSFGRKVSPRQASWAPVRTWTMCERSATCCSKLCLMKAYCCWAVLLSSTR
mmetsp:Transcript_124036/g.215057  ORF Transcript_124036/g.215057 Transcript_124036/m.215057 type:complete len:235 (-) Transcript_124036:605-1309(-)